MRIILQAPQGDGKSQVARMLAEITGYQIIEEWDGLARLPEHCIAETNCRELRIDITGDRP